MSIMPSQGIIYKEPTQVWFYPSAFPLMMMKWSFVTVVDAYHASTLLCDSNIECKACQLPYQPIAAEVICLLVGNHRQHAGLSTISTTQIFNQMLGGNFFGFTSKYFLP